MCFSNSPDPPVNTPAFAPEDPRQVRITAKDEGATKPRTIQQGDVATFVKAAPAVQTTQKSIQM